MLRPRRDFANLCERGAGGPPPILAAMKHAIALLVVVGACGGGHHEGAPDAPVVPDAPPVAGACAGKTIASMAVPGIFHGDLQIEGFETETSFRFDQQPNGLAALLGSALSFTTTYAPITVGATVKATRDDGGGDTTTLELDSVDADCTMHGTWERCANGGCYSYVLEARRTDRLDEPVAQGLTLVSEFAGNPGDLWTTNGLAVNVRVADGVAYMANYWDGLRVVDVHDPAHPVEVGHLAPEFPSSSEIYNDVKIVDGPGAKRYALMESDVAGVVVVDVTTPTAPVIAAHFGTAPGQGGATNVHSVFVDGGKAYLANIDLGLEIWDVADPVHAVKLGAWAHAAGAGTQPFPHDLYVAGARAYVNYWDAGMSIVDVSNPAAPALVADFAGYGQHTSHSNWVTTVGARTIAVHGDEQWDSHVHIVDVTEGTPAFATSIGEWGTRPEVSAHNIMAFGSRAYLTYYQDGVRVLDLSDPTHPTAIAWFDTWPGYSPDYGTSFFEGAVGLDVDLANELVYVADTKRGLIVLHLDI